MQDTLQIDERMSGIRTRCTGAAPLHTRLLIEGGLEPQTGRAPGNFSNLLPPEVKHKRWQSCLIWLIHLCNVMRVKLPKGSAGSSPWSCHLHVWMLKQASVVGSMWSSKMCTVYGKYISMHMNYTYTYAFANNKNAVFWGLFLPVISSLVSSVSHYSIFLYC